MMSSSAEDGEEANRATSGIPTGADATVRGSKKLKRELVLLVLQDFHWVGEKVGRDGPLEF